MSVRAASVIDAVGIDENTGDVVLDLLDEEDWSDEAGHLLALQEKLNSYLAFIEGGQLYQQLEAMGRKITPGELPIRVEIVARFPVTTLAQRFLEAASRLFEGAGFELTHQVCDVSAARDAFRLKDA